MLAKVGQGNTISRKKNITIDHVSNTLQPYNTFDSTEVLNIIAREEYTFLQVELDTINTYAPLFQTTTMSFTPKPKNFSSTVFNNTNNTKKTALTSK